MDAGGGWLCGRPSAVQWLALVLLSALLVGAAWVLRLPAAFMIGPLAAAITVAVSGGGVGIPAPPFIVAQGVIGCMVGASLPLAVFADAARHWPVFALGIAGVIAAAGGVGYVLTRLGFLPGTTAIWGISPGASTPMILMSEAYGADPRLVAVMQKLRVTCVIAVAAVVARVWGPTPAGAAGIDSLPSAWLAPVSLGALLTMGLVAGGGALLAARLAIPAGPMLVPLVAAMVVKGTGLAALDVPPWLLAASYALVGWSIGLRFTRAVLRHALLALPRILASIFALIAISGGIAVLMVVLAGIDPLTAYLATSPGGADSIAIIAASTPVDLRFVMTMQTARLVIVLVVSPILSRSIAQRALTR